MTHLYRMFYGGMNPTKWTPDAIMCYRRKFVCKGCFINETYPTLKNRCYMKHSVFSLIKSLGLPKDFCDEISDNICEKNEKER